MIASHSMRLGQKNSTNLEQLDYLQDLNRLLFSNVVDGVKNGTGKCEGPGEGEGGGSMG
jgi:hypothetical protein